VAEDGRDEHVDAADSVLSVSLAVPALESIVPEEGADPLLIPSSPVQTVEHATGHQSAIVLYLRDASETVKQCATYISLVRVFKYLSIAWRAGRTRSHVA
jgi:hypothetical protein